jgi:tripartite-type tricarboxylate transporter receptor subunit TctC
MKVKTAAAVLLSCAIQAYAPMAAAQIPQGKPVRLVIGFLAGGPTDVLARVLAQKMSEGLGTNVFVDNRAGAAGNIAAELVAKSPPDGLTLYLPVVSHVINPHLYGKVNYDPIKDFTSITYIASTPYLIIAHPSLPAKNVKELVAFAKSRPGQLNFSSSGNGTGSHLAGEVFRQTTGIDIVHVPYRSAAPALTDLVAGQVMLQFNNPLSALPLVKTGRIKALAVMSAKRNAGAPEVPTLAESGYTGGEVGSWSGIVGPAGLPRAIVNRYHQELLRVLAIPDVRSRLLAEGAEIIAGGPEDLDQLIKGELAKWAKVVSTSGARID